jgi:serine beta-lactamase-like protein LACTB
MDPFMSTLRSARRRGALLLLVVLTGCISSGTSRRIDSDDVARVTAAERIAGSIAVDSQDPLPGHAGAVGREGRIVLSRAAGLADVRSARPATPRTRFRIDSTSKSLGAVPAMALAEAGRLDLDAPISRHLPGLPTHIGVVSVRQLLAHRSGIRHYRDGEWDSVSDSRCASPGEALGDFVDDPLEFAPGTDYRYTTFGYVLLSAVLEAADGRPFDVLMRERIFKPAGMTSAAMEGRPTARVNGGGFISTAEDLVRFGLALVDGRLVSAGSLQQMLRIHSAGGGNAPPYGYGFIPGDALVDTFGVAIEDFVPNWWHGGNGRGGYSVLIIYPDHRAAAAITTNVRASGRLVRATHMLALPFLRPWTR